MFCNGSSSKTVAAEKIQPNPTQWEGMGGVMGNNACLDLAMTSQSPPAFSIYVCPTPNGASEISNYLPSNFCQAEQAGNCFPAGTAIDKSLNIYYVDPVNAQLVECTEASSWQTCIVLARELCPCGLRANRALSKGVNVLCHGLGYGHLLRQSVEGDQFEAFSDFKSRPAAGQRGG